MNKLVSIIIPAYNESANIPHIINAVKDTFTNQLYNYEIIIIDDGSKDNSIDIAREISLNDLTVKFIELSRNFGKDQALKAGIDLATGDALVTIDADMQHPPSLILEMIHQWELGYEVVYAYRQEKNPHAKLKNKIGSKLFYKLVNFLSDINLEDGIADYRLIDKKVIKTLSQISEYELFLRGMVKWIGFKQIGIPYTPSPRLIGESTYQIKTLIKLALHGITSFSVKPLYTAVYLGFFLSFSSILYIPYVIYSFLANIEVSGWASIIMTIVFFGGLQLIILGIIGIYVGKMFMQTKNRPNYIIRSTNIQQK
ncbi:dolichol-phosphate mannosyltransferase [Pedobacter terrae]|uniref:Dolichol-phosphate mannosyltransferase n=1 Tax=Pedobacter terrae TaxID=405671 RepID=A0A1G8A5D0_9SPHI|nr:glycosyltransferase family 2 protein [Pedobacter terrae]SDH16081.1 dolichol-phosphate mannosyltransferase [Pedobacter terrae]